MFTVFNSVFSKVNKNLSTSNNSVDLFNQRFFSDLRLALDEYNRRREQGFECSLINVLTDDIVKHYTTD